MSEHSSPKAADEIDLGQLFAMVKDGFKKLGNIVLHIFLFFKKNLFILLGLILLGVGISFALKQFTSKKLKSELIIRPNFESTDYLVDAVEEIKTNLATNNKSFFESIEINPENAKGFEIELEAIADEEVVSEDKVLNQIRYLETLNKFKGEAYVKDILRAELTEKSVGNYKLTFQYHDAKNGTAIIERIIEYLNTNEYFNEIKEIHATNAKAKIENNKALIKQIDEVITNYSNSLKPNNAGVSNNSLYTDKEPLNVPSLLSLKNRFVENIQEKQFELVQQSKIISILNYGKTQEVTKEFFEGWGFRIPLALVLGFLFYRFIQYLNSKAKELS